MKTITTLYKETADQLNMLQEIPLLLIRFLLAYCFYVPATSKWQDIGATASWFASQGIPVPTLSAYLAAGIEASGVILLVLGFGTRLIALLLMAVMSVAIATVHVANGFKADDNGYEINLYYLVMLSVLVVYGAGKTSVDHFFRKRYI